MSSVGSGGPTSWQASLLQAAAKGEEAKFRELLREGIVHGEKYKIALRIALQKVAGRGHESLTRLLLQEGVEVNALAEGEAPTIYKASEVGKHSIVKALLDYGADVEARDKTQRTAIFPAALKNHCEILQTLLNAGANVNAIDGNEQNVLLCLASERPERPTKWGSSLIRVLLDTDLDLETKDRDGRTALLWAAATGREFLASLLLTGRAKDNANIRSTNNRGKTALHLAAENHRTALVTLLLENGADPHARSDGGWTALHNAADRGHEDIASLLLEYGARVNATTSSGMTALHWCSRNGHLKVVELLLKQRGIRRNCKDSFDSTPMLGAAQNGHLDIVERLSPADDGFYLSASARGACEGFQATVVDFGMENRPVNHTKHSVFDVLYGWDQKAQKPLVTTLTRNVPAKPRFRWIHLPTNNMTWVEAILTKNFVENRTKDVEGFKLLEKSFVQLHRGPTVHAHFMRPQCQRMPPTSRAPLPINESETGQDKKDPDQPKTPVLKVEITPPKENGNLEPNNEKSNVKTNEKTSEKTPEKTQKKLGRKGDKLDKGTSSPQSPGGIKKSGKSLRPDSSPHGNRKPRQQGRNRTPSGRQEKKTEPSGNMVLFMPYLHYETHRKRKKMSNVIKEATSSSGRPALAQTCDEMLIHAYLHSSHNLQIRRTLDQFYYHAISTDDRDEDQVIYRYTKDKGKEVKVFMVDQLWLWTLGDDLIVSSFPQRWEQPKNDPLNVLDGIIEDMSSKTRPPVKSIYELALLITGRCSGVFDRHRIGVEDYQFLDMFESSIGEVTNKETKLFKKFNDASSLAAQWLKSHHRGRGHSPPDSHADGSTNNEKDLISRNPAFVDTLLDIGEETALLAETKDIRDELNMISLVLKYQLSILDDMVSAILQELKGRQDRQAEIKRRVRELSKVVDVHLIDVERMDRQAEGIYDSLAHLLDLKQKHANAFEARFARDQATFTGRQGQTIMVFTIVTVVFLPMSFIAALFTIPIRDFPHQTVDGSPSLPLSYVSKFVFGVGLAISIPLIAIAFAVEDLSSIFRRSSRGFSWGSGPRKRDGGSPTGAGGGQISYGHHAVGGHERLNAGDDNETSINLSRRSDDSHNKRYSSRDARGYDDSDNDGVHLSSPVRSRPPRRSFAGGHRPSLDTGRWKEESPWKGPGGGLRGAGGARDLERGVGAR